VALLPADPKQRKQVLVLVAALIGGLIYAFYAYVATPRNEQIAEMETRLTTLETKNRRSRALAAARDQLQQQMEVTERQLVLFERFIPQSEEVPELLDAISSQAQLTGVRLARMRPQASEPGEYYTKHTWELSVLGEYHDVGRYLARIASLPRIIKPTRVQMSPAPRNRATEEMEAPLEVSFNIETFVLETVIDTMAAADGRGATGG
jgi:type IV pilus assembly protein PilO